MHSIISANQNLSQFEGEMDHDNKSIQSNFEKRKRRYGKNAVLKGMNLKEGATAKERNAQIGGHRE